MALPLKCIADSMATVNGTRVTNAKTSGQITCPVAGNAAPVSSLADSGVPAPFSAPGAGSIGCCLFDRSDLDAVPEQNPQKVLY